MDAASEHRYEVPHLRMAWNGDQRSTVDLGLDRQQFDPVIAAPSRNHVIEFRERHGDWRRTDRHLDRDLGGRALS